MKRLTLTTSAIALSFMIAACAAPEAVDETTLDTAPEVVAEVDHSVEIAEARAFLERAEAELAAQSRIAAQAYWNQATNITPETNALAAEAGAASTILAVSLANESKQFDVSVLPADLARKMTMLRTGITIPAPSTPGAAEELSQITTNLDATYGTGKFTYKGEALNLDQLSTIIETSRDPEELKAVWEGWRTISVPMKDDYARMVEIANEGANELGFESLDQMWLSGYDMAPEEMEAEVQRLWTQVEPLYEELHCFTRAKLNEEYGDDVQPRTGPIRADLLGNMWAQQWSSIYDVVKPDVPGPSYDLTERLNEKGYDAIKMVETGETFFTSLGLEPLPETFWERSMIVRPEGREVV
ncbi:M2 family metallopeptidase, partial [Hyphomonas sp. UBA3201]